MTPLKAKAAVLLGAALAAAGCVMSSTPTGPVGLPSKTVSTIAGQPGVLGSNLPAASVSALLADFWYPAGMVYVASTNSIYIADSGNSTIRQLNLTTGQVTTLAGYPGQAGYFDNANNPTLYANFNSPEGITTDNTYLYVADSGNNLIRRVSLTSTPVGLVDTLAGNETIIPAGFRDGTGTGAHFNNPLGICYDSSNTSLYVADSGNSAVRQITALTGAANTGVVTTIAGSPTTATFYWPEGIVFDSANLNLYVVDSGYDEVLQVTTGGVVTTLAGSGTKGDTDGTGYAAQFNWPEGIAIDPTNTYLFVADTLNSVIRQVTISSSVVTTLAGQGEVTGSADGAGNVATFNHPMRAAVNGTEVYVADTYNETIRLIK
jgi:DNA-binding beta-propeller fold protein YncE